MFRLNILAASKPRYALCTRMAQNVSMARCTAAARALATSGTCKDGGTPSRGPPRPSPPTNTNLSHTTSASLPSRNAAACSDFGKCNFASSSRSWSRRTWSRAVTGDPRVVAADLSAVHTKASPQAKTRTCQLPDAVSGRCVRVWGLDDGGFAASASSKSAMPQAASTSRTHLTSRMRSMTGSLTRVKRASWASAQPMAFANALKSPPPSDSARRRARSR
mmetsp:Transcript_7180/g.20071  ORF Transcript_7180/g.20071 Transcript_7180/m.20071 type:complete len:220 (-) Transcript_7180:274-933(-)